jgi:LPXTG-motif cell wall-anchored protein
MRWKMSAGVLAALAFLIPAAPAMAETGQPGLNAACQTGERKVFKDIRTLIKIDLDTATEVQVRILANQILFEASAEKLPVLPKAVQQRLDGTPDDLRAFLKTGVLIAWTTDLRISVVRTLSDAGAHVNDAAQKTLDDWSIDTSLAYLNEGLYAARELDCATPSSPAPSVTPSATKPGGAPVSTASAGAGGSGGQGGGLPDTGANTATVAAIGGALLLLGGAGYVIGRRRRSRFVA